MGKDMRGSGSSHSANESKIRDTHKNRKQHFESLVGELIKSRPNKEKVRELTHKLGLPLKSDPIEQLDFLLRSADDFFIEDNQTSTHVEGEV